MNRMAMKKTAFAVAVAFAAAAAFAAPSARSARRGAAAPAAAADDEAASDGQRIKVDVERMPRPGKGCCLAAPSIGGATMIGQCYTKPRQWIVIETKYATREKFIDQLTFNWHVMLDAKTAKENKGNKLDIAPYSYFNTSVTYFNIPRGSHAACVCLPPSYLELYGEPRAIGFTIADAKGEIVGGDTVSEIKGIKNSSQFWDDQTIMGATSADGKPLVERRQGLSDRSKTIWALVNPNDYETTLQ